jgi:ParB family chromosome partitioning protein
VGDVRSPHEGQVQATERLPGARLIPLELLEPDPMQPRRTVSAARLDDLAQSIRAHGILQPLLVSSSGDGSTFRIIAGERRFRAAKLAGVGRVPCVVVSSIADDVRLEQQLVENLQREGISPLEECAAFEVLRERYGMTHQQIAERVGKGRTYVTKTLTLRRIPDHLLAELTAAGVSTREQLVLVAQQRDERAMRRLTRAMANDTRTVRALRDVASAAQTEARASSVTIRLENGATVRVTLPAGSSARDGLVRALEDALEHARSRSIGS